MAGEYLRSPGDIVGPFRIGRQIGAGMEGTVYLVSDIRNGSLGTLKLLRGRNMIEQAEHTARYYRRLHGIGSIKRFREWGVVSGERGVGERPWLAFDYIPGESLAQKIAARRIGDALNVLIKICDALLPVHRGGFAIGDFDHGRNVIVERGTGLIKFCDLDAGTPDQAPPSAAEDLSELLACAASMFAVESRVKRVRASRDLRK